MSTINEDMKNKIPWWNRGPKSTGNFILDLLIGIAGIVLAFLAIFTLLLSAAYFVVSTSTLLDGFGKGLSTQMSKHIIIGMLTGVFIGVATAIYREYRKGSKNAEEEFLSALFTGKLEIDSVFLGRVIVGGLIGILIGMQLSATGAISPFELLSDQYSTPSAQTLVGGMGGIGGSGSGDYLSLVLGLMGLSLLAGLIYGLGIQLLLFAIASAAEGATKEYIMLILKEEYPETSEPIFSGAIRGAIIGPIVGAVFTLTNLL